MLHTQLVSVDQQRLHADRPTSAARAQESEQPAVAPAKGGPVNKPGKKDGGGAGSSKRPVEYLVKWKELGYEHCT